MKTHWLKNPNKNYFGHWDLPESGNLILTIKSAKWEDVKDPVSNKLSQNRVVRFEENGIKPLICNQINSFNITKSTGKKFMQDSVGCKIKLYLASIKDQKTKEMIDCVRVDPEKLLKPELPELTPIHKKWEDAIKAINSGNVTLDAIRKSYKLSIENEKLLLS